MSPTPVLLTGDNPDRWRPRLAQWGWTLLRQLNTRHDPTIAARVHELVLVVEHCTHLEPLDLQALGRMIWAQTLIAQRAIDEAEQLGDVLEVLATLEDLADNDRRSGAALMLSTLFAEQHVTAVNVIKTVRELALRWTVRDLAAFRACDDLLVFALSFGWSRELILERTAKMRTALGKGEAHV